MHVRLGDHLDFRNGSCSPTRTAGGHIPVYGSNGAIGFAAEHNATGPLIVVGRVGSYCGSLHYCEADIWVTDNAYLCRAKEADETRFWYYALQLCRLNKYRVGSGQPLLNQRTIRDVSVQVLEPRQRRPVAELLGALDDKIAANQRVIEAAEALMIAIVESICDHVPLSSLAIRSAAFLDPEEFDDVVAHFSLPAFDDGAQPQLVNGGSVRSGKFVLSVPCVLFAKLNPRIPRVWNVLTLPTRMALASTEFVVLRPIDIDTSALWSALRQPEVTNTLRQQVAGTSGSHQRIQPRDLLDVRVPDVRRLTSVAAQTITSLGAMCQAHRTECIRLSVLRDALLPLLMSGRVRLEVRR
ncbi:Type I restriction modification DNA specificity domain protein [Mycobacterium basiliense]|uniref:Type I restriction modification DNA specificity domain protein n=1 Tax=Mycobacterium basiliense TaxID=2094119 RepID=A0A3S4FQ05_9MYCO|nr:restriction endonuclease subunit S [Mycobacterium basiliense]VDM88222.1 Type I restriction modification DNA specificity domain protein [Mycobacterium basiliense]